MFPREKEWINCVLLEVLENERGSIEVVAWLVVIPILLFFLLLASTWLNLDRQKAIGAMAARDAARVYGIELGRKNLQAAQEATARAKQVLVNGGLMKPSSNFLPQGHYPPRGQNGVEVTSLIDRGETVECTLTCYVVNPFPTLMKLIRGSTEWPYHFSYTVSGASRHEIEDVP